MRTCLMILQASLLFLLLLPTRAHGIRLDRSLLHEAINSNGDPEAAQPSNAFIVARSLSMNKQHCNGRCSGTTMDLKTPTTATAVVVVKNDRDQSVPRFHEDYYGPGGHEAGQP